MVSPLLATDIVEVRETTKLSWIIQWVQVQFLHRNVHIHTLKESIAWLGVVTVGVGRGTINNVYINGHNWHITRCPFQRWSFSREDAWTSGTWLYVTATCIYI